MSNKTIGFVGGGRVVSIILGGFVRGGAMPSDVVVSDNDDVVLEKLKRRHAAIHAVAHGNAAAAAQDIVFLALHPPAVSAVLEEIRQTLKKQAILISLAPKLTVAKLSDALGGFERIARMIPNAPSIVGEGYNPVFLGSLGGDERREIAAMLQPLGECPEVPEQHLEAYALITGMGPTYFWPQLYELHSLAESFGIPSEAVHRAIRQMLMGTIGAMYESGLSPEDVMNLIPAKPLGDIEQLIVREYRSKLASLMDKLRP